MKALFKDIALAVLLWAVLMLLIRAVKFGMALYTAV
jgi:hypothetical protein